MRRAKTGDATAIARIHVASWQKAYRGAFPDEYLDGLDWRDWLDGWRLRVEDLALTVLVAVEGDRVLGFASAGPPRDPGFRAEVCAELYAIYLDPERWAQGVGGALLDAVIDELPAQVRTLLLWVLAGNERAIGFYERHGFRPDGVRRPITRGGHEAGQVRYRRTLPRRDPAKT